MAFPDIEQTETEWMIRGRTVMRSENITIMDGMVTRYRIGQGDDQISASRDGVLVTIGWQISTPEDIQTLHTIIDAAWADARRHSREDRFGGKVLAR